MTTGFVFGGAGTRGDFQVGAARLLFDRGILPEVITGSSGGAIVALKLAEGGPAAAQRAESLLRSLPNAGRIYQRQPWLAQLVATGDYVQQTAAWLQANGLGVLGVALPALPFIASPGFIASSTIAAGGAAIAVAPLLERGIEAESLCDPAPLRQLLRDNVNMEAVAASGIRLRLGVVGIETAELRFVSESGQLVTLGRSAQAADCAPLQTRLDEARAEVSRLNAEIRDYVFTDPGQPDPEYQSLIRARNRASTTTKELMRAQASTGCPVDAQIDLVEAAVASGAMPGFFPPVELARERYVDGGLRSLLPIRAAREAGADRIYAIYPKPDLTRETVTGQLRIAQFLNRAIDLMLEELRFLETTTTSTPASVTLIQPSPGLMIHGDLVVEPGRASISVGYGYMRASDVIDTTSLDPDQQQTLRTISDLITNVRLACWNLEQFIFGTETQTPSLTGNPADPAVRVSAGEADFVNVIRARKWMINHLVMRRIELGGAVPADAATWSGGWEAHDWQPDNDGPWESFGPVPAADLATYTDVGIGIREASSNEVFLLRGNQRFTVPGGTLDQAVYPVEDGCLQFLELAGVLPPPPPPPADPCAALRLENLALLDQLERLNQELRPPATPEPAAGSRGSASPQTSCLVMLECQS